MWEKEYSDGHNNNNNIIVIINSTHFRSSRAALMAAFSSSVFSDVALFGSPLEDDIHRATGTFFRSIELLRGWEAMRRGAKAVTVRIEHDRNMIVVTTQQQSNKRGFFQETTTEIISNQ